MPKQPVLYEAMYILDSALDEAGVQTAVGTLEEFVRSNGGEVVATREFGKRRLAYEIDGHTSGTYMILYFKAFGELVPELQHEMRLVDSVVRGIICVANPKALFEPKKAVAEEPAPEAAPAEEAAAEEAAAAPAEEVAETPAEEAAAAPAEEAAAAPVEEAPAAPAEEAAAPTEEAPAAEAEEAPATEAPAPAAEEEA